MSKNLNSYKKVLLLSLLFLFAIINSSENNIRKNNDINNSEELNSLDNVLDKILNKLLKEQSIKDLEFRAFPPKFSQIKGIFKSYIHLNIVDKNNSIISSLMRNKLDCLDMNMFVTNFVLIILLELNELKSIDLINDKSKKEVLISGLEGILQFRDKNYNENIPIYTFWRQKKLTDKWWSQYPDSMVGILESKPDVSLLIKFFKFVKLDKIAKYFELFNNLWEVFGNIYRISSDLDDTFTALALRSRLIALNNSEINTIFTNKNTDLKSLFLYVKKFAYRPSNNNVDSIPNPIDPRAYYWLHDFIIYYKNKYSEDKFKRLAFPTTWMWDIKTQRISNKYINVPLSTNNIDLNVSSNFFFGISNLILFDNNTQNLEDIIDSEIIEMLYNLEELLEYVINYNIVNKRPDISLLYYPSVWDFYWMLSRTCNLISNNIFNDNFFQENNYFKSNNKLKNILLDINSKLSNLLEINTDVYLKTKLKSKRDNELYVSEFLGNYSGKERNEDSLFATSLVFNTLINTKTYEKIIISESNKKTQILWKKDVNSEDKETIKKIYNYINNSYKEIHSSKENAFFSGSVKNGYSTNPIYYPANYFKYLNGTDFDPNSSKFDKNPILGVYGYFSEEEFIKEKNKKHFNRDVPNESGDLASSMFPYWSSPAITHSLTLLGLTKYKNIITNNEINEIDEIIELSRSYK